jgi:hypothetical protein
MATGTKNDTRSAADEAAEATERVAETQEQAARQWTRSQEQAIGAVRDAQTDLLRSFPSPTEVIESSYDFAVQALQMQKEFALRWIEWVTPRVPASEETDRTKKSRR